MALMNMPFNVDTNDLSLLLEMLSVLSLIFNSSLLTSHNFFVEIFWLVKIGFKASKKVFFNDRLKVCPLS